MNEEEDLWFPADLKEQRKRAVEEQIRDEMILLERLRDEIDLRKCRDAYIQSYLKAGAFFGWHEDCSKSIQNTTISADAILRFEKENPHYAVSNRTVPLAGNRVTVTLKETMFQREDKKE